VNLHAIMFLSSFVISTVDVRNRSLASRVVLSVEFLCEPVNFIKHLQNVVNIHGRA